MGSDIGRGGICGQILLVIINIIFIALGIIVLALGAWAIASNNLFNFIPGSLIGGAALLIIIGGVIVIIAAVGLFGAICKVRFLLVIYALVVLVCVILEIVGGILIIVYRDVVLDVFTTSAQSEIIARYDPNTPDNDVGQTVQAIQNTFGCCGVVNASDWVNLNLDAVTTNMGQPPFCPTCNSLEPNCATYTFTRNLSGILVPDFFNATTVGCVSVGTTALLGFTIGAGAVAIVFGLFEISGIIIALLLCCCIQRAHQQTVV